MGAYGLMIDAIHSSELAGQAKTIEDLNKKCDLLYEWVKYLNGEIENLKRDKISVPEKEIEDN